MIRIELSREDAIDFLKHVEKFPIELNSPKEHYDPLENVYKKVKTQLILQAKGSDSK